MSGLSDLLQRLNTEGWSSRRIESEADRHGYRLSNATAAKYLKGNHPTTPNDDTLVALAAVFSVDPDRLRTAAGLPGGGTPFDLGPEATRLTGPQRDVIRTTVRLFVEQNDALADQPVRDVATTHPSDRRLTLLSDDAPDLTGRAWAADEEHEGDDPGEDDH